MSELDYLLEDAAAAEGITHDEILTETVRKIHRLLAVEAEMKLLQDKLAAVTETYRKLSEQEIPEWLYQHGLSEIRLQDGKKVIIKEGVQASVADMAAFVDFLTARGEEALLKTTVAVGKRSTEELIWLQHAIIEHFGEEPTIEQKVHPMTLKAYAREKCAEDATFFDDKPFLKIFRTKKTIVKEK